MDLPWVKDVERQLRTLMQRTAHLPTRVRGGGSGGGGTADGIIGYDVLLIADLPEEPDMPRKCFAWVNENNGLYMRNPANNGWVCLNRFE